MAATPPGARPTRRLPALQRVGLELLLRRRVEPCRTPRGMHSRPTGRTLTTPGRRAIAGICAASTRMTRALNPLFQPGHGDPARGLDTLQQPVLGRLQTRRYCCAMQLVQRSAKRAARSANDGSVDRPITSISRTAWMLRGWTDTGIGNPWGDPADEDGCPPAPSAA